jgi:hypothetical protein
VICQHSPVTTANRLCLLSLLLRVVLLRVVLLLLGCVLLLLLLLLCGLVLMSDGDDCWSLSGSWHPLVLVAMAASCMCYCIASSAAPALWAGTKAHRCRMM